MPETPDTPARPVAGAALAWLCLAIVAGLSLACGSTGSGGAVQPDVTEPAPLADTEAACGALDELACLTSAGCTLRQAEDKSYFCAAPASDCETGFVQGSATAEACGEGCTLVPAQCYCAPGLTCFCGGGPPAQCLAAG